MLLAISFPYLALYYVHSLLGVSSEQADELRRTLIDVGARRDAAESHAQALQAVHDSLESQLKKASVKVLPMQY